MRPQGMASQSMLGMRLDQVGPQIYIPAIVDAARNGRGGYCCVANVHMCVLAHDDPAFRAVVNGARLVVADSTVLQAARRMRFGAGPVQTMRGAEMMLALCAAAAEAGVRVGLVGGRDEGALARLVAVLRARVRGLEIVFTTSPPFGGMSAAEDAAMVAAIGESGPQLIFVGLGCPKQERWMAAHEGRLAAVMIGVGAAFDFNAGLVPVSPGWVHRAGLEWLYRLLREPRRLWRRYLTTSPRFVWLLAREAITGRS